MMKKFDFLPGTGIPTIKYQKVNSLKRRQEQGLVYLNGYLMLGMSPLIIHHLSTKNKARPMRFSPGMKKLNDSDSGGLKVREIFLQQPEIL